MAGSNIPSWGSRVTDALKGVVVGFVLIGVSLYFVFWNEGNSLHTAQSLKQTQQVIVPVQNAPVDPANNMKVVYFSGEAQTENVLTDDLFNIAETAIQLNRHVDLYQWDEDRDDSGDSTTYTYKKVWRDSLIDSSNFHDQTGHQNPQTMPIKPQVQYAESVNVGDFMLSHDLITGITGDTVVSLKHVDLKELQSQFDKPVKLQDAELYFGNPAAPEVGDMRVRLTMVMPQVVSVIAQQTDHTLQSYVPAAGIPISLIEMGNVSSDEMIHRAEVDNQIMAWVIRGLTLLGMIIGFALILRPLQVMAGFIPFAGAIVGFGVTIISLITGFALWSAAVAIAWFAVRPMIAVGVVIAALIVVIYIFTRHRQPVKGE